MTALPPDFPTLLEAIMAWHRLPPDQAQRATIRVIGGPLHTAAEITAASLWTFSKRFSRTSQFGWGRMSYCSRAALVFGVELR